jgi:hypothetical protein
MGEGHFDLRLDLGVLDLSFDLVPTRQAALATIAGSVSSTNRSAENAARAIRFRPVRIWRISPGRSSPEIRRAFLLFGRQQFRPGQLAQKFLRRPLRRVEIKSLFQIGARRVGHRDDKRLGLRDERERFFQFLFRANVRRHRRRQHDVATLRFSTSAKAKRRDRKASSDASTHQSHSQPLGISTGGLMSRMSLAAAGKDDVWFVAMS